MTSATASQPTDMIATLRPIWTDLLPDLEDDVSEDTNFFDAGGHSLKAMLMMTQLQQATGKNVPLFALVDNPTLSSFSKYVSDMDVTEEIEEEKAPDGSGSQTERLLGYNDPTRRDRRNKWFEQYYASAMSSDAHAKFCTKVYGDNFGQHGMADFAQIDKMLEQLNPGKGDKVLDMGCGYGLISKYISEKTGANVVGVDLSESAIDFANDMAKDNDKLSFQVMDIQDLTFDPNTFTHIISIDTVYYAQSLHELLVRFKEIGTKNLSLGILRTFPIRSFTAQTWSPHLTELASELKSLFGKYKTFDLSKEENLHWRKKVDVLDELKGEFENEGNMDLFEFRYKEASYEAGIEQFRYMFVTG